MKKIKHKKAITLTEVLMASVIMSVALTSLLIGFVSASVLNMGNRNLIHSTNHAQYVLEDIVNTPFNQVASKIDNGDWNWDETDIVSQGLTSLSGEYIAVTYSGTDLLNLNVAVSWQDRGGRSRSITLKTLLTETG